MIIMFIAILLVIGCFGIFTVTYQVNGLNRLFIYTPLSIVEKCVIVQGENGLKFYKGKLEAQLNNYYDERIKEYTDKYEISYYFYRQLNFAYCTDLYCDSVEVSVTATLNFNYQYERTVYFEVAKMYE